MRCEEHMGWTQLSFKRETATQWSEARPSHAVSNQQEREIDNKPFYSWSEQSDHLKYIKIFNSKTKKS